MKAWLMHALTTTLLWGVWGAFAGLPGEHGVPETINYVVWSLTMIPPAVFVLRRGGRSLARDRRSILLGLSIGVLGAAGQLVLFYAVRIGPPYLIFPIISLSPALTIALSLALLKERTGMLGALGIALALLALPLFDYRADGEPAGYGLWFLLALVVLVAWGVQAYVIKLANATMDAASIFFYMNLFSRMSDGRVPRGPLYELVRERLGIQTDLDLCSRIYGDGADKRSAFAQFAPLVDEAAQLGDTRASTIFKRAADELVNCVLATRSALEVPDDTVLPVSHSGGVFSGTSRLLPYFRDALAAAPVPFDHVPPQYPPAVGAALYAARLAGKPLSTAALQSLRQQCAVAGLTR